MALFKKTVDSIVADITTKIQHLRAVADLHHAEAGVHDEMAKERAKLAAFLRSERDRARAIATRLQELVHGAPSAPSSSNSTTVSGSPK